MMARPEVGKCEKNHATGSKSLYMMIFSCMKRLTENGYKIADPSNVHIAKIVRMQKITHWPMEFTCTLQLPILINEERMTTQRVMAEHTVFI